MRKNISTLKLPHYKGTAGKAAVRIPQRGTAADEHALRAGG